MVVFMFCFFEFNYWSLLEIVFFFQASVVAMARAALPANGRWGLGFGVVLIPSRHSLLLPHNRRVARGVRGNIESPTPALRNDTKSVQHCGLAEVHCRTRY